MLLQERNTSYGFRPEDLPMDSEETSDPSPCVHFPRARNRIDCVDLFLRRRKVQCTQGLTRILRVSSIHGDNQTAFDSLSRSGSGILLESQPDTNMYRASSSLDCIIDRGPNDFTTGL